jgi:hypothetical protein
MNIAMIKTSTFNMMNKKKNVNLFFIILKNVEKHFEKHNKLNIVIKNVLSVEYHEFLNVFDQKTFNILASHRFYDHKIVTITILSLVKDVTMCILYSLVACWSSKSQHCILFRSKFDSLIYDTNRNRMLRLNDREFESSDDRVQVCVRTRKIWAKHDWEHDLNRSCWDDLTGTTRRTLY